MSKKLIVDYGRNISKIVDGEPKVALPGTNHVMNPDVWDDNTIYDGEVAIDLNNGIIYTSDGNSIIRISSENRIINGLQVLAPSIADTNDPNNLSLGLEVSSGYAMIKSKIYKYNSVSGTGILDIFVNPTGGHERYDLIWGVYSNDKYNSNDVYNKLDIKVVSGAGDIETLINNEDDYLPYQNGIKCGYDSCILLAIVWVPRGYDVGSPHMIRPFSWNVDGDKRKYNIITNNNYDSVRINEFIGYIKNHIFDYVEGGVWREKKVYLGGCVVKYDGKLYYADKTKFVNSINDLDEISGNGSNYVAGDGIDINNNEISVKYDGSSIKLNEDGNLYADIDIPEYNAGEGIKIDNGSISVKYDGSSIKLNEDGELYTEVTGGLDDYNRLFFADIKRGNGIAIEFDKELVEGVNNILDSDNLNIYNGDKIILDNNNLKITNVDNGLQTNILNDIILKYGIKEGSYLGENEMKWIAGAGYIYGFHYVSGMEMYLWGDGGFYKYDGSVMTQIDSHGFNGFHYVRDTEMYLWGGNGFWKYDGVSMDQIDSRGFGGFHYVIDTEMYLWVDGFYKYFSSMQDFTEINLSFIFKHNDTVIHRYDFTQSVGDYEFTDKFTINAENNDNIYLTLLSDIDYNITIKDLKFSSQICGIN